MATKKWILGGILAVLLILAIANSAAAYVAAWLNQQFVVEEPIEVTLIGDTPVSNVVYPGEDFTTTLQIRNLATVAYYDMVYDAWITWRWVSKEGEKTLKFLLSSQPVEGQEVLLKIPEDNQPLPVPLASSEYLGSVWLMVDPDGPGPREYQPYPPGQMVTILPGGIHFLRATVRPHHEIPPGNWEVQFLVDRRQNEMGAK